jgi:XRE family transcriptional regulator, aerobic/anaerobic benzoate catabolism transcriptional regulator
VVAQGDLRPFSGKAQGPGRSAALDEIRKLLADRERLYARAPLAVDTTGKTVRQTLQELRKALS